jgi:hypothetical protein
MTGPPPLSLHLGSGARERGFSAAIWLMAGGAMGLWMQARGWFGVDGVGRMLGASLGAVVAAAVGAVVARPMQGQLTWDGQAWSLRPRGAAQALDIHALRLAIDLGVLVVLRARRGRWALVTRHEAGAQWHGLQMALRFGRGPSSPDAAP